MPGFPVGEWGSFSFLIVKHVRTRSRLPSNTHLLSLPALQFGVAVRAYGSVGQRRERPKAELAFATETDVSLSVSGFNLKGQTRKRRQPERKLTTQDLVVDQDSVDKDPLGEVRRFLWLPDRLRLRLGWRGLRRG